VLREKDNKYLYRHGDVVEENDIDNVLAAHRWRCSAEGAVEEQAPFTVIRITNGKKHTQYYNNCSIFERNVSATFASHPGLLLAHYIQRQQHWHNE